MQISNKLGSWLLTSFFLIFILFYQAVSRSKENRFKTHGSFYGTGLLVKMIKGPGPHPKSEFIYTSFSNINFNLIAINPENGRFYRFNSPITNEQAAYGLVAGADNRIYLGTSSSAHLMRLNWEERRIDDLGTPLPTEKYIWGLALGSDKKIYGCTFPNSKLFSYDPITGISTDFGRMDQYEDYARDIISDDNGFIYIGIGMQQRHLVAFEISTGKHIDILPENCKGTGVCLLTKNENGEIFARAGKYFLALHKWSAKIIEFNPFPNPDELKLSNGKTCTINDNLVKISSSSHQRTFPIRNETNKLGIFRIGLGPDNNIYGSTYLPLYLFKLNTRSNKISPIGRLGNGEIYSFISIKDKLIACSYAGMAPIIVYNPSIAYNPNTTLHGNPWLVNYSDMDLGWRPMALVLDNINRVYIGSTAGYGQLAGALTIFEPETGKVILYKNLVNDQSICCLSILPDGRVVGGTNVQGGGGSHSTQKDAVLFIWDPVSESKAFQIIPIPGQSKIDALSTASNGLVYGFSGEFFFIFDPKSLKVIKITSHQLGTVIYNALGIGSDSVTYGLTNKGIFKIDPIQNQTKLVTKYPKGITGGFAICDKSIFFISGSEILSYNFE